MVDEHVENEWNLYDNQSFYLGVGWKVRTKYWFPMSNEQRINVSRSSGYGIENVG